MGILELRLRRVGSVVLGSVCPNRTLHLKYKASWSELSLNFAVCNQRKEQPERTTLIVTIKKHWALKNWCFWTVVLEKTLESPLDCKEIQLVHPKGDQSWTFIECWSSNPLASWGEEPTLLGKDPDAGKDWRWEEKGLTGWDGWIASQTQRT